MKPLPTLTFDVEFLTPCFSGTAEGNAPGTPSVLRVPPIRGHIRMWHITLFGASDANAVWGSTAGTGCGSKVAAALTAVPMPSTEKASILPHKGSRGGSRAVLPAGSSARIVLTRLPGCTAEEWDHAEKAARLWLLLGTLGLRANRAAGSVWPAGDWVPKDVPGLKAALAALGCKQVVQMADPSLVKDPRLAHEEKDTMRCREAASDTVGGSPQFFGDIRPSRKPSPLKMKVARLGGTAVVLLTGLDAASMTAARARLKGHPLGDVAWHSI